MAGRMRWLTATLAGVTVAMFALLGVRAAAVAPFPQARPTFPAASTLTPLPTQSATQPLSANDSALTGSARLDEFGQLTVIGTLTTGTGEPIPDADIRIRFDGETLTVVTTDAQGGFTLLTVSPSGASTGSHSITLVYRGSGLYNPSEITLPVMSSATAAVLTGMLNPTSIAPGGVVEVSGTLTDPLGTPLPGARVDVALSVGGMATGVTADDGRWAVFIQLPPYDPNNPVSSSTKVWVTFPGDGMFPPTDMTLALAMLAYTPSPTPTPTPTASSSPTDTPSATAEVSPSASAAAPAGPTWVDSLPGATATVGLAIVLVLIATLGALIGATVLSRRRSTLTVGEQRGFGDLLEEPSP